MKKLQNNFTTPEQSKRLLELGVPRWTADEYRDEKGFRHSLECILDVELFFQNFPKYTPCWSVGQLIEICLKCSTLEQRQVRFFCNGDDDEYSLIDYVVTVLESGVMTNHMDFSKLED